MMPRGWRTGLGGEAVCPHRDLSVCSRCRAAHAGRVIEVFGKHYWAETEDDAAYLASLDVEQG